MADDAKPAPRVLTEGEAYAISAANVQRETAELTTKVDTLNKEKAELQSKLDVSEAAVQTEKTARETAEQALTDYKAEVEREKAAQSRRGEREKKVREAASHLPDTFFTEERLARWATQDDTAFEAYLKEIAELAPAGSTATGAPRETAMTGATPVSPGSGGAMKKMFDLRSGVNA
jgi:chromosome segregation ATPase